jgi:Fe-S oxidoreductase
LFKKIFNTITDMTASITITGNTLYYPGCLTRFKLPLIAENYQKILESLGINFIIIPEINCCGKPLQVAGFHEDFVDIIKKNKYLLRKYKVRKIITNCPSCSKVFNEVYGIKTEHITETISKNLSKISENKYSEPISYHDPCNLSRGRGITEEPRIILKYLGFEIVEMLNHGKKSLCCGAGGGVKNNYPEVSNKIAKIRLNQCKTKKLITSCALCYKNLKENAPKNIKVLELSEVIK